MTSVSLKDRAREELRRYAIVVAYLYVCFVALFLYKAALLGYQGTHALPHGFALVKALIIGKFLLIGDALVSTGSTGHLGGRILRRSVMLFVVLLMLSAAEELIVGAVHHRAMAETVADLAGQGGLIILARGLIMFLVLMPIVAAEILRREGRLAVRPASATEPGEKPAGGPG